MLENMKMETKLMSVVALMAVIVLIIGMVGIVGMSQVSKSRDEIAKVTLPGIIQPEINKAAQAAIQSGERTFSFLKGVLIAAIVLSVIFAMAIGIRIKKDVSLVIVRLKDEVRTIINSGAGGRPATRGDPEKVNHEFRDIIKGLNDILDASVSTTAQQGNAAQKVASGDLTVLLPIRSELDIVAISMNAVIASMSDLRNEINLLNKCSREGKLSEHGRPEQFRGAYAEIVQNVYQIHEWSVLMKNNMQALVADTSVLAKAAVEGDYAVRADALKHQGDFRQVVSSVNEILDAVTEQLKVAAEYRERIAKGEISPKISDDDKVDPQSIFLEMIARNKPYF